MPHRWIYLWISCLSLQSQYLMITMGSGGPFEFYSGHKHCRCDFGKTVARLSVFTISHRGEPININKYRFSAVRCSIIIYLYPIYHTS
jgi:hypothetical protein